MRSGGWRIWIVAGGLCALHFLLRVGFGLDRGVPDFLVLGLLLLSREMRLGTAAWVGLGLGLCEDAFSVLTFGANAFALALVAGLASRSREYFVGDSVLFLFGYLAAGVWLRRFLYWIVAGADRAPGVLLLLVEVPISAVYTAAVGLLVVFVTGAWWETAP